MHVGRLRWICNQSDSPNRLTQEMTMKLGKEYSFFERATLAFMVATCCVHPALAGTQGAYMNSAGSGVAVDVIAYSTLSYKATSPYMSYPNARVSNMTDEECAAAGWDGCAKIAARFPDEVYCQSRGYPNYIWSIQAYVVGGITADNAYLQEELNIIPADCVEINVDTSATFNDLNSGVILVNGSATGGAAIGLRAYEYSGANLEPTLADLLGKDGALRFKYLLPGPFDYGAIGDECAGLKIPFTTVNGHENLYVVTDTVALSNPITFTCPEAVTFSCNDPVVYPLPEIATGCTSQPIYVSYDPPAELLPLGESVVTATFSYENGEVLSTAPTDLNPNPEPLQCQFTATRTIGPDAFDGFFPPIKGHGGKCNETIARINGGRDIPIKFALSCGDQPIVLQGEPHIQILDCDGGIAAEGDFHQASNEWHFNWDTSSVEPGIYQVVASVPVPPNVLKQYAFIEIR